jgi:tetratricopeptide (TPR) repeat protein
LETSTAAKRKAQELVRKGQIREAIGQMRNLLAEGEPDPYDHVYLGDLLMRVGDHANAIGAYQEAIRSYERMGLFRNAIAIGKKVLRVESGRADIHRSLAGLYDREGLKGEAMPHYLAYLDSFSGEVVPPNEFLETLEQAAELVGSKVELALRLADHFVRVRRGPQAADLLERLADQAERGGSTEVAGDLRGRAAEARGGGPQTALDPSAVESSASRGGDETERYTIDMEATDAASPASSDAADYGALDLSTSEPESSLPPTGLDIPLETEDPGIVDLGLDDAEEGSDAAASGIEEPGSDLSDLSGGDELSGRAEPPEDASSPLEFERSPETVWEIDESEGFERGMAVSSASDEPDLAEPDPSRVEQSDRPGLGESDSPDPVEFDEPHSTLPDEQDCGESDELGFAEADEPCRVEPDGDAEPAGVLGASAEDSESEEGRRERAECAFLEGRWEEARAFFDAEHRANPQDRRVLAKLVDIARHLKDSAAQVEYLCQLGDAWIAEDRLEEALEAYLDVLRLDPRDPTATRRLSRFRELGLDVGPALSGVTGDEDGATDGAEASTADAGDGAEDATAGAGAAEGEDPGWTHTGTPEVSILRGEGYRKEDWAELSGLIDQFKVGLKEQMDGSDYQGHYDLAVSHRAMGLFAEALEEIDQMLDNPDLPPEIERQARELMGSCLAALDQKDEAVLKRRKALERAGADPEGRRTALYHLAQALEAVEEWQEAFERYSELQSEAPGFLDTEERVQVCKKMRRKSKRNARRSQSPPPAA